MLERTTCPVCQGSGIQIIQASSMWGLVRREVPSSCESCNGLGYTIELPPCKICSGRGLVGNESEICRACNGTGKVDTFALIPLSLLTPGTLFERHCDKCNNASYEIISPVEEFKLVKSWDSDEELRQVELVNRVKVACAMCAHSYHIQVDPTYHQEISSEQAIELERLGLNVGFLYQARPSPQTGSQQAAPPV